MINIAYLYLIAIPPLAICFGIFGSFSMWEKTSFFGHSFSHSLLFPLSIALLLGAVKSEWILLITVLFAVIFVACFYKFGQKYNGYYSQDTLLVIASFFCLGLSLFINNLSGKKVDVMMYIAGDIMFINKIDIFLLYLIAIILVLFTYKFYKILILRIISSEIAITTNKKADFISACFIMLYAIFITISSRAIGVLLISATVLMPSIISRLFAKNTTQMIILSILLGYIIMNIGAMCSIGFNIQFSPIIIIMYSCLLLIFYCKSIFKIKHL